MRKSGSGKKIIWGIGTLLGLLISLVVIGCASTKGEFIKFSTEIYPPKSEAQEILLTQDDINKPYKEIALVKANGSRFSNEGECFEKIRQIAREVGADAVIKAHVEEKERLVHSRISNKPPETVIYKVKEPVCEGTAVVFTKNG